MRIAVANAFWATAGGGETYSLAIAKALARRDDVELLGPPGVDWARLGERLQADLSDLGTRAVDFSSHGPLVAAAADYDLLVNTSHGNDVPCGAPRGILVVHFPFRLDADLSVLPRTALRMLLRSQRMRGRAGVQWGDGFHNLEGGGPVWRWTDGDAVLELWVGAGRTVPVEVVFGGDRPSPTRADLVYEGTVVASAEVGGAGAPPTTATFLVTGRPDGRPVRIHVVSETFRPAELWGAPDERTLGVQVMAARVGNDLLQRVERRAPFLERAEQLRWLDTYDRILVNSSFTAGWVRRWWGRPSEVLYPAVPPLTTGGEKEQLILSVGRFFAPERGHSKKQLEMVLAFRRLVEAGVTGWELHLVGGCQPEDRHYLERVRAMAMGLPVVFHVDAPGAELRDLYGRSSIYWHATGLFEDATLAPERQEHFGIAVVEAMSAGCVPVVHGAAGPGETVEPEVAGLHFSSVDGLVRQTRRLVDDAGLRSRLAAGALTASARYTPDALAERLDAVVDGLRCEPSSPR